MILTRENPIGLNYTLTTIPSGTKIEVAHRAGSSAIVVKATIEELNQGWYYWMRQGRFVQDAFPFLNVDEQEFLQTGITPEDWERTFGVSK